MKYLFFLSAAVLFFFALPAHAAWYWPFGDDEDSPNAKPRLHQLLENANDLIEQAEDAALDGNAEKALELYNSALTNLVDVAAKNPDRAEKPEFAPLRNKIAATSAAIDSIRFAQVNSNIRAVAVTDTTELQKKYDEEQAKKKGQKKPKDKKNKESAATEEKSGSKLSDKKADKPESAVKPPASPPVAASPAQKSVPAKPVVVAGLDSRVQTALSEIQAKDYAAADLLLADLEKEFPDDLNVLILRAAAQNGLKYHLAARRTLEKAMRAHPKHYLPYYNLAYLMFKIEGEGVKSAKQYYELGRALGGPTDARLERMFK
jgi:outer membrane biosynthesis protein TonB